MTGSAHRDTPTLRDGALSSQQLAVVLLFGLVTIFAAMAQAQSDTWWQLRSGAEIGKNRAVSYVESYSHTARGAYWPNHEWLTEVLFHAMHAAGGMPLLAGFCALTIVLAYALSWRLSSGRFEVRFGLFALALTAGVGAWSMRPQVVTMACFMATCTLLAKDRVWVLPPLFVVWANLHGAVAIGLIAVGAVLVCDVVSNWRVPSRLLVVAVACFAATAVTPMGIGLWQLLLSYGQRTKTQGISEWSPPGAPPEYIAFWAIAALLLITTFRRWRHLSHQARRLAAIALVTMPMALSAHRNVALFLLVAVPALSALLADPAPRPPAPAPRDFNIGNTIFAGIAAAIAAVFVGWTWVHPPDRLGWHPMTADAVAAIKRCRQPLYNSLGLGGTLIWFVPEQPVFIDNRNDPYPVQLLEANRRLEESGDYQVLFAAFGIACAVVQPESFTDVRLAADRAWRPTYRDRGIAVYETNRSVSASPDHQPR